MEVKAVGKPKPVGKWLKHGEEIIPSKEFVIENFDDGTSVLTISEVYPDDTGEIVYEAQNPLGVAVSTTVLVVESVEGKKIFSKSVANFKLLLQLSLRFFLPFPFLSTNTLLYSYNPLQHLLDQQTKA